jgi:hypothetical protein
VQRTRSSSTNAKVSLSYDDDSFHKAKELLDKLDSAGGGPIQTKVWDRFELTKMLLSSQCADLLLQFFPEHQRREAIAKLDAAREVVEAALPRFVVGEIRIRLVPEKERWELLSGSKIWPNDASQQAIIDLLKTDLSRWWGGALDKAVKKVDDLDFDAFMSFCDILIRNFSSIAMEFLKAVAKTSGDASVIFNAVDILRENRYFTFDEELKITCNFDRDLLHELYGDWVDETFRNRSFWTSHIYGFDECQIRTIDITGIDFYGGESGIFVTAKVEVDFDVLVDPDEPPRMFTRRFTAEAHLENGDVAIDSVEQSGRP